jgi:predicted nuclease of predicted toxin-antitoxin system
MRFLIDANLSPKVAARLREAGHEATHVNDVGLTTADDDVILARAAEAGEVIVTADADFGALLHWVTRLARRWCCCGLLTTLLPTINRPWC